MVDEPAWARRRASERGVLGSGGIRVFVKSGIGSVDKLVTLKAKWIVRFYFIREVFFFGWRRRHQGVHRGWLLRVDTFWKGGSHRSGLPALFIAGSLEKSETGGFS